MDCRTLLYHEICVTVLCGRCDQFYATKTGSVLSLLLIVAVLFVLARQVQHFGGAIRETL